MAGAVQSEQTHSLAQRNLGIAPGPMQRLSIIFDATVVLFVPDRELASKVLVNGVTSEVGTSLQVSDLRTNRAVTLSLRCNFARFLFVARLRVSKG
jgi:hypothetical protein